MKQQLLLPLQTTNRASFTMDHSNVEMSTNATRIHEPSPSVKFLIPQRSSNTPVNGEHSRFSIETPSYASTLIYNPNNTTIDQALNRSTYNPILTPKGERGASMALLSPSRSIVETLTTLVTTTAHELEKVWDEVGYSPDDRASQLNDLLVKFKDICEEKIVEETAVAETFRQTIVEAKEEIIRTATALKADLDITEIMENTEVQTLTDELATLEASLEGLRAAANEAKIDLQEARDYILEAHAALGIAMEPTFNDVDSDLTANRRLLFHEKKCEMKEELTTRTNAVINLVRDCQQLMNDLRMEPEKNGSTLDKRIAGSIVRSKDGGFVMASKFRSETCVGITPKALEELTHYVAELHGEKRERKIQLQEMGAEIGILWERLRIPEEDQLRFTQSVQGLGSDTIMKGEQELKRLKMLKAQMIGELIQETRDTISELWDQVNANSSFRNEFTPFYIRNSDLLNDDLLEKHEEYIRVLVAKLEQMKPILRLLERRELIIRERSQYEEYQKDPERLQQRGAAMTRQLMEEEKMAKRIKKELPRITTLIIEKIEEWNDAQGEDFLFCGESYLEVIDRQETEWNQYKVEEMQRKLKKKQEESIVENRYIQTQSSSVHPTKKGVIVQLGRPLTENTRNNEQPPRSRSQSRDPLRTIPLRELGQKQNSSKL
jgi:Ase1/PRC1/MAP65 family protein